MIDQLALIVEDIDADRHVLYAAPQREREGEQSQSQ
jgi:hypothetical protein